MKGGRIVDPVPDVSHDVPRTAQRRDDAKLLRGRDPAEFVGGPEPRAKRFIRQLFDLGAEEGFTSIVADGFANMLRDVFVVTRDNLDGYSQRGEFLECRGGAFLRRIEKKREPAKDQLGLIAESRVSAIGCGVAPRNTQNTKALKAKTGKHFHARARSGRHPAVPFPVPLQIP